MVGEEDVALHLLAEAGIFFELGFGHLLHDGGTAAFVFEDFHSVEPVLDVVAADEDARGRRRGMRN